MHRVRTTDDDGFTLVELLTVIVILGVLMAIAVPSYIAQRQRARSAAVQSVLRDLATMQEAHLAETGAYGDLPDLLDFAATPSVTVRMVSGVGSALAFCATAAHRGGGVDWYFDSDGGGLLARGVSCT